MTAMATTGVTPHPMTNSHILVHDFAYLKPGTVEEALAMLSAYGSAARLLAGGTDLLVQMKMERLQPEYIIDIGGLDELKEIRAIKGRLVIGALATIRRIAREETVARQYTALAEGCASFSTAQVQVMGTVGGNLCNGSPASDSAPALIAFGAVAVMRGPEGESRLPLEAFFRGPGKTALRPDQMLVAIELPAVPPAGECGWGSAFLKVGRVAADIAKANAAVSLLREGDRIVDCTMAFGSVAPTPRRARQAEDLLRGRSLTPELAARAAALAASEMSPIDDVRSTADYRRKVVTALAMDGLNRAWQRAAAPPMAVTAPAEAQPVVAGKGDGHGNGHQGDRASMLSDYRASIAQGERARACTGRVIELTVNGARRRLRVADNDLLLNLLREDLELTGTKYGCGIGECSACTVLMDDQPVLACLVLAASADGRRIQTVEGLASADGALDPLQEAFLDYAALQCGFCTPGMLLTAKSLLMEKAHPTEADVREQLRGNMCRCTGYAAIVRAVLAAAGN